MTGTMMEAAAEAKVENGLVVGVTVQNWPAPSPDTVQFNPGAYAAGLRGFNDGVPMERVGVLYGRSMESPSWRRWCVEGWLQAQTVDAKRQAVKR